MYTFSNLKLLRKDTVKRAVWFSKKIQHAIMFISRDRKMASEFR